MTDSVPGLGSGRTGDQSQGGYGAGGDDSYGVRTRLPTPSLTRLIRNSPPVVAAAAAMEMTPAVETMAPLEELLVDLGKTTHMAHLELQGVAHLLAKTVNTVSLWLSSP